MNNSIASSQVMQDRKLFNWRTFEPSMLPEGMNSSLALELVTFRDKLDEMLAGHEGEFVVIKGDKIIGYHADRDDAVNEVFEKFGTQSALVKKVMELEPLLQLGSIA
jgi:hypothetical protein